MIEIGSHVGRIAMEVEQGSRPRGLGWNPPTRKLIAFERKCDVVEWLARVTRSGIDTATGVVEDLRLRVPNCPCKDEVANCDSGKQCPC